MSDMHTTGQEWDGAPPDVDLGKGVESGGHGGVAPPAELARAPCCERCWARRVWRGHC